jgi:hypothetical protein
VTPRGFTDIRAEWGRGKDFLDSRLVCAPWRLTSPASVYPLPDNKAVPMYNLFVSGNSDALLTLGGWGPLTCSAGRETRMAYECETRIAYVTTIPRVTEPGTVALFQCEHCEKIDIRSIEGG